MQSIIVDINIAADEYIKNYQHYSAVVNANSRDGRRVNFPAKLLQAYVSHSGISGSFKICFDDKGKYISIDRLST